MQPRERFVEANGLSQHVLEWGDEAAREVVVMCHGFLDLAWGFAELGAGLARAGLRAIAFDFRGHGESGWVPSGGYYYFPDYVLDMHALLPQLAPGPIHLIGHSMGGTVSALFAATHPGEVRSLALLEGLGPPAEDEARAPARMKSWLSSVVGARRAESRAQLRDRDHALTRLRNRHPEAPERLLALLAEKSTCPHPNGSGLTWRFDPLHRTLSPHAFDAGRFAHFLAQIEAPTLIVHGERGFRVREHDARASSIRAARNAAIEGAGHMLHWTHPAALLALVLEHIRGS